MEKKEVEEWEVDWQFFLDQDVSFEDSKQRFIRKFLQDRMLEKRTQGHSDSNFNALNYELFIFKQSIDAIHMERLKQCTKHYFMQKFNVTEDKLRYIPKGTGVQLGIKVKIQLPDRVLKYHVKTHEATNGRFPFPNGRCLSSCTAVSYDNPCFSVILIDSDAKF